MDVFNDLVVEVVSVMSSVVVSVLMSSGVLLMIVVVWESPSVISSGKTVGVGVVVVAFWFSVVVVGWEFDLVKTPNISYIVSKRFS